MLNTKDTNPKDAIGVQKAPIHFVPVRVIFEIGLGMLEGALKYGGHNYRIAGVRSSIYYDALMRHIGAWWEGEDIDPESGLPHVVKALSCLAVLRDAQHNGKLTDDRPPKLQAGWMKELNEKTKELLSKYPNPVEPYTQHTIEKEDSLKASQKVI